MGLNLDLERKHVIDEFGGRLPLSSIFSSCYLPAQCHCHELMPVCTLLFDIRLFSYTIISANTHSFVLSLFTDYEAGAIIAMVTECIHCIVLFTTGGFYDFILFAFDQLVPAQRLYAKKNESLINLIPSGAITRALESRPSMM